VMIRLGTRARACSDNRRLEIGRLW